MPHPVQAASEALKLRAAEARGVAVAEAAEATGQYGKAGGAWTETAKLARKVAAHQAQNPSLPLDPAPGGEARAQQYDSNALRAKALAKPGGAPGRRLLDYASMSRGGRYARVGLGAALGWLAQRILR